MEKETMKKKIAAIVTATALLCSMAVPANAHYDAWTTHYHVNSTGIYVSCSVWDKWFNGCVDKYVRLW